MKILQKGGTQVSRIDRRIGRNKIFHGREQQIGAWDEEEITADMSEEQRQIWVRLPEWKKKQIIEKIEGSRDYREEGNPEDGLTSFSDANESGCKVEDEIPGVEENRHSYREDAENQGLDSDHNKEYPFKNTRHNEDYDKNKEFLGADENETFVIGKKKGADKKGDSQSEAKVSSRKKKNKLNRWINRGIAVRQSSQNVRVADDRDLSQRTDHVIQKVKHGLNRKMSSAAMKVLKLTFKAIATAVGSVTGAILIVFVIIVCILAVLIGSLGQSGMGRANVSPECEQYRSLVTQYAKEHEIEEFVEIILCIMMQESGGRVPDVMQCSECPFNTKYPHAPNSIDDPEYSIDVGIQNFKACLESAGCTTVQDMDGVKLALQSYNYGNGYAEWAKENYGGYSLENAKLFSVIWAAKYGWSRYGDPEYVPHVLQYYIISGGFTIDGITNEEALEQLEMLSESWPADMDERRGAVISKGANLIGLTTYDMYGEDTRSGVDNPRTLDCSSFVAWAFQKTGFTDVPYGSTTGTYVSAANFKEIQASELVPGDIGLINIIPEGGSNHVGIYAGKDSNGTSMWLHCTSHSSPGCSTVTDGPRISYYSSFTIFYRYTGFID